MVVAKTFIPALGRLMQPDLCEFEGSLVYSMSSRSAKATQTNPISKNRTKQKTKTPTKSWVNVSFCSVFTANPPHSCNLFVVMVGGFRDRYLPFRSHNFLCALFSEVLSCLLLCYDRFRFSCASLVILEGTMDKFYT